ncbi:ABC transporter ATP-binding protein [Marinomonas sp. C2222]|uniref:ABC transporter ATP-binding protein n=1 Tax=Marinomonas sargassi TaxID=2984494 RepID=A0ABT2YV24_9GAMM|nr:ABC transporter ATP-binding protein [Marinomonas sargassi]MCV2403753.1 ABC transporter ATP-binding protein [Marinomonas sargassi]
MNLNLDQISISYGKTKILSDITTGSLQKGNVIALLGSNGAGKSTLVKALAGLVPYQGKASLGDLEFAQMTQEQRLALIGYVPQTLPQASSLLAYEVVKSAANSLLKSQSVSAMEEAIEEVFQKLKISHLALLPMHKLSGGQKQMVSLAQAIVRQPELYLLDEPTSALDLNWQIQVLETVRNEVKKNQSTAVLVCHDINLALRYCDHILLLNQGQLLSSGLPKECLTPDTLAKAYQVSARVETCSLGRPMILVDHAL